jgi:hypothetical protein
MSEVSAARSQFMGQLQLWGEQTSHPPGVRRIFQQIGVISELVDESALPAYAHYCEERLKELDMPVASQGVTGKIDKEQRKGGGTELMRAVGDISSRLFSALRKPSSSDELDVCTALVRQVHDLGDGSSIDAALAQWLSRSEVPIADLECNYAELLKLAPHLIAVNLTDYEQVADRLPLAEFLKVCSSVKKLTFYCNEITPEVVEALGTLTSLEQVQIDRCQISGTIAGSVFTKWPNLKGVTIRGVANAVSALDFQGCSKLEFLRLDHLPHFSGPLVLPRSVYFTELSLSSLPEFNAQLDFSTVPNLETVFLDQLNIFNQPLLLDRVKGLMHLTVTNCTKWARDITLPSDSPLKEISLQDDRAFFGSLNALGECYSLEKMNLTNCRAFGGGINFRGLKKVRQVILRNCFEYQGNVDCSEAAELEQLDVLNCKKIGTVIHPPHFAGRK